jgi:hypothetical protein
MVTVHREGAFRVVIHQNDHDPEHVHVFKDRGEVKINLIGMLGNPELVIAKGMSKREVAQALRIVVEQRDYLVAEWERIHG